MKICESFSESFSDYVENSASPEERQSMEEHLSRCPTCHSTVDRLASLRGRLHGLPHVQTSQDFESILRARIKLEHRNARVVYQSRKAFGAARFAGLSTVGLFLIILVAYARWGDHGRSEAATPTDGMNRIQSVELQNAPQSYVPPARISYTIDKYAPTSILSKAEPATGTAQKEAGGDSALARSAPNSHEPQQNAATVISF